MATKKKYATKKKSAPKPIQYRGITLNYNKRKERYHASDDGAIFAYKEHWADNNWVAGVILVLNNYLNEDEDSVICYGQSENLQEAMDTALDRAVENIDNFIQPIVDQKTFLLKMRNS